MEKKKPYYVVIDVYNLGNTVICKSILSVCSIVGVGRNSISSSGDGVYGHYLVLPRKIKK